MERKFMIKTQQFLNHYYNLLEVKKYRSDMVVDNEVLYNLFLTGCTKKYELLFDQAWKSISLILEEVISITEFAKGSPRDVLKKAYEHNLIFSDIWLDMLDDRNDGTHVYKDRIDLEEYINKIFTQYCDEFGELATKLMSIRRIEMKGDTIQKLSLL